MSEAAIERKGLSKVFWLLCTMEMWERLAYYGMRVVVPIYIAQADEPGGLHFTQAQKGSIYAWWFVFQSVLPTFTGGFADRYGYKKTIFWAINLKVIGYILMGTQREYWPFFFGTMMLATGTAIFKPGIQGSLAQTLDKTNSSKGWGIFYWLVNVGAMLGPPLAGVLRGWGWDWVFFGCAGIVSLNYLMFFTYKDPESGYEGDDSAWVVFVKTVKNIWEPRLLAFLGIMSGFWLMMYRLWDLHPNFIADWVDSSGIVPWYPEFMTHMTDRGPQVLQENLLNLNAAIIVLFLVPVSIWVARIRTLTAMLIGMMIATAGVVVSGVSMSGWVLLLGVFLFSTGEMLTGPKKNEYLALIAPEGKKGLYLGYVNIPVGIGGAIGAKLDGYFYGNFGEKAVLARDYLLTKTDYATSVRTAGWNGAAETMPNHLLEHFPSLAIDRSWSYRALKWQLDEGGTKVTETLWSAYDPYMVWIYYALIGAVCIIGLVIYNRMAKNWKDMNV